MVDSYAEEIARGVFELLRSDHLFSVYQVNEDDCMIVWTSSAEELIAARIQEGLDA